MTELCIYQITNTELRNDLIIAVFYGNLIDVRKKGGHMKKLKLVGILAAVVLIGGSLSIPLINNHFAYKVDRFASYSDCSIWVLHFMYGKLQEDNLRYICFAGWKI